MTSEKHGYIVAFPGHDQANDDVDEIEQASQRRSSHCVVAPFPPVNSGRIIRVFPRQIISKRQELITRRPAAARFGNTFSKIKGFQ